MNSIAQTSQTLTPKEVVLKYGQYLQENNLEKILDLYHDDAEVIPEQLQSISGKGNLTAFYQHTFESIKIDGQLVVTSTYQTEDVAVVRCEEQGNVTNLATGLTTSNYFREMFVLTKTNGSWLIYKYMFSQNNDQIQA